MDFKALDIVYRYISEHLDKTDKPLECEAFIVWKAKEVDNAGL